VQGALELLGIPYTGSGVMASAIAMDKVMTKRVWRAEGLPTPRWVSLGRAEQGARERLRQVPDELGLPLIVKPPHEGSSIGVSKVLGYSQMQDAVALDAAAQSQHERVIAVPDQLGLPLIVKPPHEGSSIGVTKVVGYSQMQDAVALSASYDPEVLCEEFIEGDEVTCPVLGEGDTAHALPVIRIVAPEGAYDYQNKYFTDVVRYDCPSGLPAAEEAEIQRLSLAAYRALGCRGWGRADLMIRAADRRPFLLEMNTSPGMTSHSLVPMSARAAGLDYAQLCLQILAGAALDTPADQRVTAPGAPV
jgi:D-alanine-D-alanine ligase